MVEVSPGHFVRPPDEEWMPRRKVRFPARIYQPSRRNERELEPG
jgi:hypothetical protein